ncbi:MAG: hypothetical protein AAFN10_10450 [Bacteroidota bacterium]
MKKLIILMGMLAFLLPLNLEAQIPLKRKKKDNETTSSSEGGSRASRFLEKAKEKAQNANPLAAAQRAMGEVFTSTQSKLDSVSVSVLLEQNVQPANAANIGINMKSWEERGNALMVSMTQRYSNGLVKVDGEVKMNGTPAPYVGVGTYMLPITTVGGAQTVEVGTSSGNNAKVEIAPAPLVNLLKVNGTSTDQAINIAANEDLVLDLRHGAGAEGSDITITMVGKIVGTKLLYDIAVVPSQDQITLPYEVFYHPFGGGFTYLTDNYLIISRNVEEIVNVPGVGAVRTVATYKDWVPVHFTGEFERYPTGMTKTAEGITIDTEVDGIKTKLNKPNAFSGRAFASGSKLAVSSFVVRGMLQSKTVESSSGAYSTTITTTTSTFPKLPEASWDAFLEEAYQQFEKTLLEQWQIELVPIEQTKQAPSYQRLIPSQDEVTEAVIARGYKGSDALIPTYSYDGIVMPSFTFGTDQPESRIIREMGVDGLIAVTIDCTMAGKDGETVLNPSMAIKIVGLPNGHKSGPTVYAQGLIAAEGNTLDDANAQGGSYAERLAFMFEIDKIISAFGSGLAEMKTQEENLPYAKIWALKAQ